MSHCYISLCASTHKNIMYKQVGRYCKPISADIFLLHVHSLEVNPVCSQKQIHCILLRYSKEKPPINLSINNFKLPVFPFTLVRIGVHCGEMRSAFTSHKWLTPFSVPWLLTVIFFCRMLYIILFLSCLYKVFLGPLEAPLKSQYLWVYHPVCAFLPSTYLNFWLSSYYFLKIQNHLCHHL